MRHLFYALLSLFLLSHIVKEAGLLDPEPPQQGVSGKRKALDYDYEKREYIYKIDPDTGEVIIDTSYQNIEEELDDVLILY